MSVDLVIRNARYLVTVDASNRILENATLVINRGVITEINPAKVPDARQLSLLCHFCAVGLKA